MPIGEISLDAQIDWAERTAKREREYWNRRAAENRANPAYAAAQIRLADAVVATLKQLAHGEAAGG